MSATFDHDYYYADMIGVDFLRLLTEVAGDITVGDTTAVGEYSYATDATLSEMLAEAKAFWEDGVTEAAGGDAVTGFSPTTPKTYFDSFRDDATATGNWTGTGAPGRGWAKGLRYWHAQWGFDDTVEAVWEWLMSFTSNEDAEEGDASDYEIANTRIGTFDPRQALTEEIDTANETNAVGSVPSLYDWATAGLLAGIMGEQDPVSLQVVKELLAHRRERRGDAFTRGVSQRDDLRLMVFSGLSYQTGYLDTATRQWDCAAAAMIGNVYRHAPEAYPTVRP